MLDKAVGQQNGADGKIQKTSRYPGVDDPVRVMAVNEQLGAHGGIHLSHPAGKGQDTRRHLIDGHTADRFQQLCIGGFQNTLDFPCHGVSQSYHGLLSLSFSMIDSIS